MHMRAHTHTNTHTGCPSTTHKIPVQDPVGVEVVNPIEYLVQKRLNHVLGNLLRLLISFGSAVVLDNVLGTSRGEKTVV